MIISQAYADYILQTGYFISSASDSCLIELTSRYEALYEPLPRNGTISIHDFGYRAIPKLYAPMDKESMDKTGITAIQQQSVLNLTGKEVLIGFIDSGIDYRNEVFRRSDGTTRVVGIWDQTKQNGLPPEGFLYGRNYSEALINTMLHEPVMAEEDTIDESGHGTFLAGLAAGKENILAGFAGAAPEAEILMVKLKPAKQYLRSFFEIAPEAEAYQENDIMMGIRYLILEAYRRQQPLVICLGLGTSFGGHDSYSPLSVFLNDLSFAFQIILTVAMGNEAASRHHFLGSINEHDQFEDVEVRVGEGEQGFSLELWANAPEIYSIAITSPSGEVITRIPPRQQSSTFRFVFENTTVSVDYQSIIALSGQFLILIRFDSPAPGIWTLRVYNDFFINGSYNLWLPLEQFLSSDTYFLRSNPDITLTVPASTNNVISMGAYDQKTDTIYLNSGRGYTATGDIKPDLVAPGVDVLGPTPQGNFLRRSGTSIAAAITAGASAQLLEWAVVRSNQPNINTREARLVPQQHKLYQAEDEKR
ncbi:MAG: S8 family peptidase, partial [Lachnospiraceae bacterium]